MHKLQTKHKELKTKTPAFAKASAGRQTSDYRDLEERTTEFARRVVRLCKELPKDEINRRLVGQIIRSSGSIGANYREANEALSKKDFIYRVRITRKEAKETGHWLELIKEANHGLAARMQGLCEETVEFRKIFSAIITKSSG